MEFIPKKHDRSTSKPIYLLLVEDPLSTENFTYYKSSDLNENNYYVEFRGFQLTKKQAEQLTKNPNATSVKMEEKSVNRKIPWHRVIRIDNVKYKIPQGE